MAYVGTVTLHDKEGQALQTVRYGRMPQADAGQMDWRMAQDVQAVVTKRLMPAVVLTDGVPEMMNLLDGALASHAPAATQVVRLVDFWHLLEKLGAAAVLCGGGGGMAPGQREDGRAKHALGPEPDKSCSVRSPAYAKQQSALTSASEARTQCVSSALWELCGGAARVDEAKGRLYSD